MIQWNAANPLFGLLILMSMVVLASATMMGVSTVSSSTLAMLPTSPAPDAPVLDPVLHVPASPVSPFAPN